MDMLRAEHLININVDQLRVNQNTRQISRSSMVHRNKSAREVIIRRNNKIVQRNNKIVRRNNEIING